MNDDTSGIVWKVLECVDAIPPSHAVTYGDIAQIVDTAARQVGRVLAEYGHGAPWWRVTNARGRLPEPLAQRALPYWREEGFTLTPDGHGIDLEQHRLTIDAFIEILEGPIP